MSYSQRTLIPHHFIKKLNAVLLLFILIGVSSLAQAVVFDPWAKFSSLKTEHFVIHYPKNVSPLIEEFAKMSERIHDELSQKYDWNPRGKTHVVLVDNTDMFNGSAAVIPYNYLLLYVNPPHADTSLDHYYDYLELLMTHEYTHILHIDQHQGISKPLRWVFGKVVAPNGETPGWMREGIASYEETVATGRGRVDSATVDMMVRAAVLENQFPSLDQIAGTGHSWPSAQSKYVFGMKFIEWLVKQYGEDKVMAHMKKQSRIPLISFLFLNRNAKKIFGKSFYKLWRDFKADLTASYTAERDRIQTQGITPLSPTLTHKRDTFKYFTTERSGPGYAYLQSSIDNSSKVKIYSTTESKKPDKEFGFSPIGQFSFSGDGKWIAYSTLTNQTERYNAYSQISLYNIEKKKGFSWSKKDKYDDPKKKRSRFLAQKYWQSEPVESVRTMDPDFSPADGGARYLVAVATDLGTDNLVLYDVKTGVDFIKAGQRVLGSLKGKFLTNAKPFTQFSNPRFSPDGNKIAVSQKEVGGHRDIVIYSKSGKLLQKITNDAARDTYPIWSKDGDHIYYISDKTGISNVYKYHLASGHHKPYVQRVTNVVNGVFQPQLSGDGKTLYVQYYTAKGPQIYQVPLASLRDYPIHAAKKSLAKSPKRHTNNWSQAQLTRNSEGYLEAQPIEVEGSKKYHPLPHLLAPHYILPGYQVFDDSFVFSLGIGNHDALLRHAWSLYVNYRTDASFVGAGGLYSYQRFNPYIYTGFSRYAVNWGNLFGNGVDFIEHRLQGFAGFGYRPYKKSKHFFSVQYFYEDRGTDTLVPVASRSALTTLDRYAGFTLQYTFNKVKKYPNAISFESGPYLKLKFDYTDEMFGAASVNEQRVFVGDARYYFEMPYLDHHVLALKAAGGAVWGDSELLGTFRFGGPFGEGVLAGHSTRLFPFRGFPVVSFAGDNVLVFSGEYRFPIATIERGLGTWPFFLNKIHGAFFADYGDIWARNGKALKDTFDNFFLGVGAEVKADIVIGYFLPATARLGYAVIVTNRSRLPNVEDSLTKMNITNGTFYFQFGTSF